MLKQDTNKNIIFDKDEAMRFEGDTGPYLLYTYARARSILAKAGYKQQKVEVIEVNGEEKRLASELSKFPEAVRHAYDNLAPNSIANYAFQLSQTFNEFYHKVQVIGSENEQLRLALVDCFSIVLKNSLHLLGIKTIEKM
jgi:arginyl-tRNA synthetase